MKGMRKSAILAAIIGIAVVQVARAEGRGKEVFDGFCNRCHGTEGQGNKGLEAPLIAAMPAWYVEAQLDKFRKGLRGKHPSDDPGMRMRPIARAIDEADVASVSAYVAALPPQKSVATLEGTDIAKGKAAYALCMGCHGPVGQGVPAMKAAALAGQNDWYLLTQIKNFKTGVRSGPLMQGIWANPTLDDATLRNITAYVSSLPAK